MDTENRLEKIRAAVGRLSPDVHACSVYKGRDEEAAMVAGFVLAGLERGEQCICVVDDGGDLIRDALASEDVDVESEVRAGRIILYDWRLSNKLRTPEMALKFEQWVVEARKSGHAGCRICGEMTWALAGGLKDLAEFESGLYRTRFYERHRCIGLCQFDVGMFSPEMLREMIIVHPVVVIGDRVCRNPYYVPPEKYLSPDWPKRETDWMIENLEQFEVARDNLRISEESYRALARRLVSVQEQERRDIARELHDRVGQELTAMRINMDLIRTLSAEQGDAQIRARAEDSIQLVESTFKAVQDVMYDLRPPMLDEFGLVGPLRWYARKFTERTGIHVEIVGSESLRLDADVETALFRIAQEALNNVARHSRAQNVWIELRDTDEGTEFSVEDDGVGFDTSRDPRPGKTGYGLVTMRERAAAVGGTLEVSSEKNGRTRISVKGPRKRT